jgi:hypothetical protein
VPNLINFTRRALLFSDGSSLELPPPFDDIRDVTRGPVPELLVRIRRDSRHRGGKLYYGHHIGAARSYVERRVGELTHGWPMTEGEWLESGDPGRMLYLLNRRPKGGRAGGAALARKARLFACACVRRGHALGWFRDSMGAAVELAEAYADGLRPRRDLRRAREETCGGFDGSFWAVDTATCWEAVEAALRSGCLKDAPTRARCADLVRCVFGNPFRPVTLGPALLTPTAVGLGRAAYDERLLPEGRLDPERLSVLADALEDEGACPEVVGHLRALGPHVRGCHVIDALSGRS